jgi:hypothetical protein
MLRLHPKLLRQKDWPFHQDNSPSHTSFFTREYLTKNKLTVLSHPLISPDLVSLQLFCFLPFWHQLRWQRQNHRQYWTASQSTTSRMQNCINARNGAHTWKGTTSRVMVASKHKVSFWPDGSTSSGNYESESYACSIKMWVLTCSVSGGYIAKYRFPEQNKWNWATENTKFLLAAAW